MIAAVKAGTIYFAVVFALGFLLGTVRVLVLVPVVDEVAAVLLETPIMLLASWIAARWSADRFDVPTEISARVVMGAIAFALLMIAELLVSGLILGRPLQDTLTAYQSPPGVIGLCAQVMFALFPAAQAVLLRRRLL